MPRVLLAPLFVSALLVVSPCLAAPASGKTAVAAAPAAKSPGAAARGSKARPAVVMHRDAGCGCCVNWAEHLRKAGFPVEVRVEDDMQALKDRLGVPRDSRSCHTAEVAGYFVEGHVPVEDVEKLLATRPKGRGIAVPGMPVGSPGMEVPGVAAQSYTVEFVDAAGSTRVFATH